MSACRSRMASSSATPRRESLDEQWREQLAARKHELVALIAEAESLRAAPTVAGAPEADRRRPAAVRPPGPQRGRLLLPALASHLDPRQPLYGVEPEGLLTAALRPRRSRKSRPSRSSRSVASRPRGPTTSPASAPAAPSPSSRRGNSREAGEDVARVLLVRQSFPHHVPRRCGCRTHVRSVRHRVRRHAHALNTGSVSDRLDYLRDRAAARVATADERPRSGSRNRRRIEEATVAAVKRYEPGYYAGRVDVFLPSEAWRSSGDRTRRVEAGGRAGGRTRGARRMRRRQHASWSRTSAFWPPF